MDFPAEYTKQFPDKGITVQVSKAGGGTLGKKYAKGIWSYCASETSDGTILMVGDDLYVGSEKSHEEVAEEVLIYAESNEQIPD